MSSLYRDTLLYHYKHPMHFGELSKCTHSGTAVNPLCGDTLTLQLLMKDAIVEDVAWKGVGCAISQASMSLFSDYIKGKKDDTLIMENADRIYDLLGMRVTSGREKCATLPIEVLKSALN